MQEAVIVSTARTPIGKAFRGAFNMTHGATMGGHVIQHAVKRAGLEGAEVDDVIMGCAMPQGATGQNIARMAAIRAGLPVTVSGMTVNRFCSSGLQTIAMAAQRIMTGEATTIVAGGLESCSLVADQRTPVYEDWLLEHKPAMWMTMIETADIVAERYGVTREMQDSFALESQRRTASAQQARKFDDEIVPLPAVKKVVNKDTKEETTEAVTLTRDEGNRPDTSSGRPCRAQAGARGRLHHGRQCEPVVRRRLRGRRHGGGRGGAPRPDADGHLPRLRGRRLRAGRDGHRPGVRGAEAA